MSSPNRIMPTRALVSVSDKTHLVALGEVLTEHSIDIVSTGSTAHQLREAGIAVTEVSEVTGFAEALDGRVKTLHPSIHGGILADLRKPEHSRALDELGIEAFGLVIVNLYPFVATVASGATGEEVIENIDIGGPAMVRAAAKNYANVAIVVDPSAYVRLFEELQAGGTSESHRRELAGEAFAHTARYDSAVAHWFGEGSRVSYHADKQSELRYGENSHQSAAVFVTDPETPGLASAHVLQGKEMSYNNYLDADAAVRAVFDHEGPAIAIIKHQNPCGIAGDEVLSTAHRLAQECDAASAFGGVIASNRSLDGDTARSIVEIFTEVVVAPGFSAEALDVLSTKKNLRVVALPPAFSVPLVEWRHISGGVLVQDADRHFAAGSEWTQVAGTEVDSHVLRSLEFAWRAVRAVKSNAILLAQGLASVGIGMGQVNRVDSARLAVQRAGERAKGSVAASDAFFPFADGLEILLKAGVVAVVQPGGSLRDEEVIQAAKDAGVAMFFTGERHFFH
ncbi:MAG: phosphoribosylaminoimidazolecarboxamide formyltransferase/IMP cyclohydrolase [Pontimonas sp.]|jgi:phosphoribosylaminoimidazolecarboxamide formyltransferase/IMP cyclohydrolase